MDGLLKLDPGLSPHVCMRVRFTCGHLFLIACFLVYCDTALYPSQSYTIIRMMHPIFLTLFFSALKFMAMSSYQAVFLAALIHV